MIDAAQRADTRATPAKTPWALENIPPFPAVAMRLLRTLSGEDVDVAEVAKIISVEPVFASRVLKLANSALFGTYQEIIAIPDAILLLGLAHIKAITATQALGDFVNPALDRKTLRACWENSLAGAVLSEKLAVSCRMDPDFAYLGGLMRDIGRLALLVKHPDTYAKLLADSNERGSDLMAAERELFDIDHCSAGSWLIERLPFPELHEVVAWHHEPLTEGPFRMVQLVQIADRMADSLGFGVMASATVPDFEDVLNDLPDASRARFSCDPQELRAEVQTRIQSWS